MDRTLICLYFESPLQERGEHPPSHAEETQEQACEVLRLSTDRRIFWKELFGNDAADRFDVFIEECAGPPLFREHIGVLAPPAPSSSGRVPSEKSLFHEVIELSLHRMPRHALSFQSIPDLAVARSAAEMPHNEEDPALPIAQLWPMRSPWMLVHDCP